MFGIHHNINITTTYPTLYGRDRTIGSHSVNYSGKSLWKMAGFSLLMVHGYCEGKNACKNVILET